jgi:vacuolar protein sorting-associated protein 26
MSIGILKVLDLRLSFEKSKFHLKDTIVGNFQYKHFGMRIQHMELCLVKKEIYGTTSETKNIARYEILDGGPIVGEVVPIRFYLSSVEGLTPTLSIPKHGLACIYLINIILHDEDGKRYFKSHEVEIYRKKKQK